MNHNYNRERNYKVYQRFTELKDQGMSSLDAYEQISSEVFVVCGDRVAYSANTVKSIVCQTKKKGIMCS